jgi:excisionase family DNA binding protein
VNRTADTPKLLTIAEVAHLLAVNPKTVGRWEKDGVLTCLRTPGNHRRFDPRQPVIAAAIAYRNGAQS